MQYLWSKLKMALAALIFFIVVTAAMEYSSNLPPKQRAIANTIWVGLLFLIVAGMILRKFIIAAFLWYTTKR